MTIKGGGRVLDAIAMRRAPKPQRRATDKMVTIETLKVGHLLYRVGLADLSELGRMGDCDMVNHRIRVSADLNTAGTLETIMHEAWHAKLNFGSLGRMLGFHQDHDKEETFVDALTGVNIMFMRDNADFIRALIDGQNWAVPKE